MLRVMGLHKHDLFLLTLQANVMPWLILLAPKLGAWVSAPAERVCHRASVGDSDTTQHNTSGPVYSQKEVASVALGDWE